MHLIFRGIFITIVILLIAFVGFLSFLASLKPQIQTVRQVEEISLESYRAPAGHEGEKVISDSIRRAQEQAQQEKAKESQKSEESYQASQQPPFAPNEDGLPPQAEAQNNSETSALSLDDVVAREDEEEDEDEYEAQETTVRVKSSDPIGDIVNFAETSE